MTRLIDAEALKEALRKRQWHIDDIEEVERIIDNAPTVDITEQEEFAYNEGYAHGVETVRPKGKWINHRNDNGHNIADCFICGKAVQWHDEDEDGIPRFCWYCGAEMRGEEE